MTKNKNNKTTNHQTIRFQKRGDYQTIEEFVNENVGEVNPELVGEYPNLSDAEDLLLRAIRNKEKITIYGDYDCDGVTSLSIFARLREVTGCNMNFIAPGRFSDGYGITESRVEEIAENGTKTLLLVDNGVAAIEPVRLAKEKGLTVIVLDHHEPVKDELPNTDVLVDPHVTGGDIKHGFDDLCGAGLSYLFVKDLIKKIQPERIDLVREITVLAMVGTIADVVRLQYDNRAIVLSGLALARQGILPEGLRGICSALSISPESMTEEDIAWRIAPLINAAGRVSNKGASVMATILSAKDESEVKDLIEKSMKANDLRKVLTDEMAERAALYVKSLPEVPSVIVYKDTSTRAAGIAGIVAGKLVEKYHVPAIVLTPNKADPTVLKGSGRSYQDIDLLAALQKAKVDCPNINFGGHAAACGVQVSLSDLSSFQNALCKAVPKKEEAKKSSTVWYDLDVFGKDIKNTLLLEKSYAPFGAGCPLPVIRTKLHVIKTFLIGNNRHVKFITKEGADLILWNGAADPMYKTFVKQNKHIIDCVGTLTENVYQGRVTPQIVLTKMR